MGKNQDPGSGITSRIRNTVPNTVPNTAKKAKKTTGNCFIIHALCNLSSGYYLLGPSNCTQKFVQMLQKMYGLRFLTLFSCYLALFKGRIRTWYNLDGRIRHKSFMFSYHGLKLTVIEGEPICSCT
jgi:hypothetical protein